MNTKVKCLLLDDELPGLTYLRRLCEQIPGLTVVKAFDDPVRFLAYSQKNDFDFCIMDIEMPGINGIALAKQLKNVPVIFTSAYKDYAADAYDLNAIDYVRKPIEMVRLMAAVKKTIHYLNQVKEKSQKLIFQTDKGKSIVDVSKIIFIDTSEIDTRDKTVHFSNGSRLTLKNLSFNALLQILPVLGFCRINKKEVIAIKYVQHYTANAVWIDGTEEKNFEPMQFQLSDAYKEQFFKLLEN